MLLSAYGFHKSFFVVLCGRVVLGLPCGFWGDLDLDPGRRISAFILVCGRVLSEVDILQTSAFPPLTPLTPDRLSLSRNYFLLEVGLFLLAFVFIILASASSISALEQGGQSDEALKSGVLNPESFEGMSVISSCFQDFSGIPSGSLTLAERLGSQVQRKRH